MSVTLTDTQIAAITRLCNTSYEYPVGSMRCPYRIQTYRALARRGLVNIVFANVYRTGTGNIWCDYIQLTPAGQAWCDENLKSVSA